MHIKLSDHFTAGKLLRFTLPSIIMMVFTSIYGVVDGLFVARAVGSNALSSINIVIPLIFVVNAFGFMLGTGGSAEVAKALGEGREQEARRYFTMLTLTTGIIGIVISSLCLIFIRPICYLLGASELLIADCVVYGTICVAGNTFFMLQTFFQAFFITAEKPHIGLALTVASGITNMALDWLFVVGLGWGVAGAAIATCCGYIIGSSIPLIYFGMPNKSRLRFTTPHFYGKVLLRSAANGSSEMVSNISMSITTFLFNIQLMRIAGEDGVAAITIMMYVNFVFIAIMLGFSIGCAPVISFHYGAQNHRELKGLFRICMGVVAVVSIAMVIIAEIFARPMISIFSNENTALAEMSLSGFRLFAISFLFCGINIFSSAFFTALCNGKLSAAISFMRTLLLEAGAILLLPLLLGLDGIWLSLPVAEAVTLVFSVFFFARYRKVYHYL